MISRPRFGFAYQAASKLVIRGGAGLFYDRIGADRFVHAVEQGNPYSTTLDYSGSAAAPFTIQNPFPDLPLGQFVQRWANPATLTSSNLSVPFIAQVSHIPLVRQYNLNFQYEFAPNWVLEAGYVGSSGINLLDYNHNVNTAGLASASNPINGFTTTTTANVPSGYLTWAMRRLVCRPRLRRYFQLQQPADYSSQTTLPRFDFARILHV